MKRIICLLRGHDYFKVKKLNEYSLLVGCHRCGHFYGMNNNVRAILPFDKDMEEMYRICGIKGLKKYVNQDKLFNLITG